VENIYASMSQVNPLNTDGHRQVPNTVWWSLMMANISGPEMRIAMTVYDRTIGYNVNSRTISLSTFQKLTGLRRDSVMNAIKQLESSHIIVVSHGIGGSINEYLFNPHYDTWELEKQVSMDFITSTENRTSPSPTHVEPTVEANREGSTRTRTSPRVGSPTERVNKTLLKKPIKENIYTREKFEMFWKVYPKKLAKGAAEKSFNKLNPDEQLMKTITSAIERAKKSDQWTEENGKFIPYPVTWLNQRRWEDEYEGGPYVRTGIDKQVPIQKRTTDEQKRRLGDVTKLHKMQ
jgi:phage replication O-like protein O